MHVILSTVIVLDFNHADIRSNKLDYLNMNISRFTQCFRYVSEHIVNFS